MSTQEHVIVTGGSGLLGAMLVHLLIEEEDVRPVVMDVNPDPKRLEDVKDRIEYVQGDVSDADLLNKTFGKFKPISIYHLAVLPGDLCEKKPLEAVRINVNGFMNLLEAARANGVRQVLFSSSGTTTVRT